MQIVVNVVNSSGPFLFFNKNVQSSPAHWRQHFILRLGALAAAPASGPVNIVFFRNGPCQHSESGENYSCEYDSTDPPGPLPNTSKRLFYYSDEPLVFYSNPPCWYLGPTSFSTYSQLTTELHNFFLSSNSEEQAINWVVRSLWPV